VGAVAAPIGKARRAHGAVSAPGLRESAALSHAAHPIHRAAETGDRVAHRRRARGARRPKRLTPLSAQFDVVSNSVAEVKIDNQDLGGSNDLVDLDLATRGQADDVAPTGWQPPAKTDSPPMGNEPKKRKQRAKKNVLSFKLPA